MVGEVRDEGYDSIDEAIVITVPCAVYVSDQTAKIRDAFESLQCYLEREDSAEELGIALRISATLHTQKSYNIRSRGQ